MEKLFLPYHLALLAAKNNFDEECFAWYNADTELIIFHNTRIKPKGLYNSGVKKIDLHESKTLAPLYQQITDWLRENHGIVLTIYCSPHGYESDFDYLNEDLFKRNNQPKEFLSKDYYAAFDNGIEQAFNLLIETNP